MYVPNEYWDIRQIQWKYTNCVSLNHEIRSQWLKTTLRSKVWSHSNKKASSQSFCFPKHNEQNVVLFLIDKTQIFCYHGRLVIQRNR